MISTPSASSSDLPPAADALVRRIIAAFTDLALVLDRDGVIAQVTASSKLADYPGLQALVGQRWADTLSPEFREQADAALQQLHAGDRSEAREVRLRIVGLGEVPFRFTIAMLDDDRIGAFGVDLRQRQELAKRLDGAQQALSNEFEGLRQREAQYRVLFHVTAEGALLARGHKPAAVLDVNPAAAVLLGRPHESLRGTTLQQVFEAGDREQLEALMLVGAQNQSTPLRLHPLGAELQASAHVFRDAGVSVLLLRMWSLAMALSDPDEAALRAFEAVPDAFVLTDGDLRVLRANDGFARLIRHEPVSATIGEPLGRWLGIANLGSIVARLREHGSLRAVESVIHDEHRKSRAVEVTAVAVAGALSFGFVIRDLEARSEAAATPDPSGTQQLRDLVGRLSLRDIVRESSAVIEKLCLEVALNITGDNRAAAAQLLGISRQSLYNKLGQ
ncbi:MAG: PAS domain-containing protein [Deltaproteobacteria bacterium]|nr:PAS domain-containing protein [Nannocystaceae bacterium]